MKKNKLKNISYVGLTVLIIFSISIPVKKEQGFRCQRCASNKEFTTWFHYFTTNEKYERTLFENFCKDNGHEWISYNGTTKTFWGSAIVFSHGRPSILSMIPTEVWNEYLIYQNEESKKILFEKIPLISEDEEHTLYESIYNHYIETKSQSGSREVLTPSPHTTGRTDP